MVSWRRNLYILLAVQVLSTAGFSLVFPFLPLYIKELGVATWGSTEFWSGMVFSSQALTMMFVAPIWGVIADRHGRKPMLLRATMGGAVLMVLMGLVQNAEQLVVLRAIQGAVTGVISANNALVAATTPKDKTGWAMGLLMMGRWTGVSLGPVIGGLLGDAFGFRESFWITGILLAIAGFCVWFWVHEEFTPITNRRRPGVIESYRLLIAAPGMASLYALAFLRSFGQMIIYPVASLFVISLLGVETGAASITGLMLGVAAGGSALSSAYLGRLGDRISHTRVLVGSALATMLFYLPQPFVTAAWQLILLQGLAGVAAGGLLSATAALMNLWSPSGAQGATYALDNSVTAAGRTIAPLLGAAVAVWVNIRTAFFVTAVVYLVIAWLALRIGRQEAGRTVERLDYVATSRLPR